MKCYSQSRSLTRFLQFFFILISIWLIAAAQASPIKTKQTGSKNQAPTQSGERLITALVNSENVRGVYGDDGMYIFIYEPDIERILKLRAQAIPLLIAHLDDNRMLHVGTNYPVDGERVNVTVGAACLDILTLIIRQDSRFFKQKCLRELEEATISSCLRKPYEIYPEDFWKNGSLIVKPNVLRAKHNWQLAYRRRQIHFQPIEQEKN